MKLVTFCAISIRATWYPLCVATLGRQRTIAKAGAIMQEELSIIRLARRIVAAGTVAAIG